MAVKYCNPASTAWSTAEWWTTAEGTTTTTAPTGTDIADLNGAGASDLFTLDANVAAGIVICDRSALEQCQIQLVAGVTISAQIGDYGQSEMLMWYGIYGPSSGVAVLAGPLAVSNACAQSIDLFVVAGSVTLTAAASCRVQRGTTGTGTFLWTGAVTQPYAWELNVNVPKFIKADFRDLVLDLYGAVAIDADNNNIYFSNAAGANRAVINKKGPYAEIAGGLSRSGFWDVNGGYNKPTINYWVETLPAAADVRSGTDRGDGTVGTCAVPSAASVDLGVAVDNTTGTAALSAAAVEEVLAASLATAVAPSSVSPWADIVALPVETSTVDLLLGGFAGREFTDLVIGAANSVTSAASAFTSADIGKILRVTSGTNFTVGVYVITAVSNGAATLSASPGTQGATAGAGEIVNDCQGLIVYGTGNVALATAARPTTKTTLTSVPAGHQISGKLAKLYKASNGTTATEIFGVFGE